MLITILQKEMFVSTAEKRAIQIAYEQPSISIALSATQFQFREWFREPSEIMQIVRWIRK